jgi:hypothetical protein
MTKRTDPKTAAMRSLAAFKAHFTMATNAAKKAGDRKSKIKAALRASEINKRMQEFERANRRHLSKTARA